MNFYKISLLVIFLASGHLISAQSDHHEEMHDRIEALRAQFITEQLDLSPEEAQQFWPVYNQYREELEKIIGRKGHETGNKRHPGLDAMSDAEVEKMMEEEMARQNMLLDLRKDYYGRFRKVLPIKKVAKLYQAEKEFQRRLIRRLANRQQKNK